MSAEAGMSMGSVVDRLIQAVEKRVEYAFEHDAALNGVDCPNLLIFLGLVCVDVGIMTKDQFDKIAKNPNLHDAWR